MRTITPDELRETLEAHRKWCMGGGGERADLGYADLRDANLRDANLRDANLRYADLWDANLWGVDLRDANLRYADLRDANLRCADLRGADLRGANLPPPQMLLLATWGTVSDALCRDLMRYDAQSHPSPQAFGVWANSTGGCPLDQTPFQRSANFQERKECWKKGPTPSAYKLILRLFKEKGVKYEHGEVKINIEEDDE